MVILRHSGCGLRLPSRWLEVEILGVVPNRFDLQKTENLEPRLPVFIGWLWLFFVGFFRSQRV